MNDEITSQIKSYYDFWFSLNALYEKWAKEHQLTSNSLFALYIIHGYPQSTPKFLNEKLLLPKQTINTILDGFEKKGYIERKISETDKRNKQILLTDAGQAYADDVLAELYRFEEAAFRAMNAEERADMIKSNHTLVKCLRKAL